MKGTRRTGIILVFLALVLVVAVAWLQYADVRQARLNHRLIAAVDRHDAAAVRGLLDRGADPNTREEGVPPEPWGKRLFDTLRRRKQPQTFKGRPLLTRAAGAGDTQIVQALLAKGAAVNAKTDVPPDDFMTQGKENDWSMSALGGTALIDAADNSRIAIAFALIGAGADVNARDSDAESALMYANNLGLVQTLLAKGADVNARDKVGHTTLVWAVIIRESEGGDGAASAVAEALLGTGVDVNASDNNGYTALMHAVDTGSPGMERTRTVQTLLAHGAKMNARGAHWETALSIAGDGKEAHIVVLLRRAGAKQ